MGRAAGAWLGLGREAGSRLLRRSKWTDNWHEPAPERGRCRPHDTPLLSLFTVGGCVPAEGSGRSGREGLALLRTAISREWLVLIALISRAEAKPAVHRPRLAPRPWRKEQRESLQNSGGFFSFWRGWLPPEGAGEPRDRAGCGGGGGAARLADSPVPRARCLPPVEPAHF